MLTQVYKNHRALWFPSQKAKGVILYLPGFPKYPGVTEFVIFFKSKQYDVLLPMYSGTFDSGGKFSVENSVSDVALWYEFLQKKKMQVGPVKKKPTGYSQTVLFSTSYGGLVAGLALRKFKFPNIQKCIFVTPLWGMATYKDDENQSHIASETSEIMSFAYPESYRFEDKEKFFEEMAGSRVIPLMVKKIIRGDKQFTIILGKDDDVTPLAMGKTLCGEDCPEVDLHVVKGGHSSRIGWNEFTNIVNKII